MKKLLLSKIVFAIGVVAPATIAAAQSPWVPGSEIYGQTMQVQTNGVVNSITFNPDGTAQITTPGGTTVPANWSAAGNQLCLSANGGKECWPYSQPFQSGQQVSLTSNCQQLTTFIPQGTNAPPAQQSSGERG